MKHFIYVSLLASVFILLFAFESVFAQISSDIKRDKADYEKNHPNEKGYFIEEVFGVLDSADQILLNAKSTTNKRWEKIGGAMFGVPRFYSKNKFADKYFKKDGKFKRILTENILTDVSSFQKFMEKHKENSFYKVTLWKEGYLTFWMLEGRDEKEGIYMIVVPVKPKLFEEL